MMADTTKKSKSRPNIFWNVFVVGFLSLFWFIFRVAQKPARITYPCQRVALANSLLFSSFLFAPLASSPVVRWLKAMIKPIAALTFIVVLAALLLYRDYKTKQEVLAQAIHGPIGIPKAAQFAQRVVRVHDGDVTFWDFDAENYWDFVDEVTVFAMVERGVMELTGQSTPQGAWQDIMSTYQSGDQIAVKINGNNFDDCCRAYLNPLPQVAKAVARGLTSIGVPQNKIVFYEAGGRDDHGFLAYYIDAIRQDFPNVRFASSRSSDQDFGAETTGYAYDDPSAKVQYTGPLSTDTYLAEVLVQSQHLINIALFRDHHEGGEDLITGALKSHYGSTEARPSHDFQEWDKNNPIADINNNSHIKDKTRLLINEGLFGTHRGGPWEGPQQWLIFPEGTPDSLFFSFDPVAIDSVLADYIIEEHEARGRSYSGHYTLHYAAENPYYSLGIHEHKDPQSGSYDVIDYREVDLDGSQPTPTSALSPTPSSSPSPTFTPPPSPSPTSPSGTITVTAPNGGEAWQVGSNHQITWTSNGVNQVKIEYSTDNFTTIVNTIVTSTTNTGVYTWTVPDDLSTTARVRVSDALNPCIADKSDADFTISYLADTHPRLFFDASEIEALRAEAATTHQEIWLPIRDYVDSQLGTTPPLRPPPDGINAYREYGQGIIPFAFAYVMTGDPGYRNLAKAYLLTYVSWDKWNDGNERELGHAHMLLGSAIAYDWLYDALTPTERQIVRESLASWAQKMYEASSGPQQGSWGNWWIKAYVQNHNWINNSALGMAGLALLGEDERAQMWIDRASGSMSRVQYILNGIEDGSWHESIPYQSYGLTMSLPFLYNLRRIQGTDLFPHIYLRNYPRWRIYNAIPNSLQFLLTYGDFEWDWANLYRAENLLRFVAREYRDRQAEWMAQELVAADPRQAHLWSAPWSIFEFLYYDPTLGPQPPADLSKAYVFPDLEGVIWRTGWGDSDLLFGLKTGAYGGRFAFDTFTQGAYPWEPPCPDTGCELSIGHDHNDMNGFYIYKAGRWLAPESEGYHHRRATALHNTLLIDGQGQYRPSDHLYVEDFIGSDGFLEATADTPDFDYVAADATRRYKNIAGMEDITRHVVFIRPDYFVMLDNVAADAAHQYEWVSHFGSRVSVEGDWVRGDAGGGQILGVRVAAPQSFTATTGNDGLPFVRVRPASSVADTRFIHILYPTDRASWSNRPAVALLDDTGEAAAVRVQMNDGSSRTDDVLLTYAQSISALSVGPYQYDGRVAVVTRDAAGEMERLFLYGGTSLTDQAAERAVVMNLPDNALFQASYLGETVAVYGENVTAFTLYAPRADHLTVNGVSKGFTRSGDYIIYLEHPTPTPTATLTPTIGPIIPSPTLPSDHTNVALGKPVTTSNEEYLPASLLVDGIWDLPDNYWAGRGTPNWVKIDLGQDYRIARIRAGPFGKGGENNYFYNEAWNIRYVASTAPGALLDFTSVTKLSGAGALLEPGIRICRGDPGSQSSNDGYKYYDFTFEPVNARSIVFTVTRGDRDGDSNGAELEVFSEPISSPSPDPRPTLTPTSTPTATPVPTPGANPVYFFPLILKR
ncbi:MAG: DUF4962 domain-containing protein [Anaerolineae bacterium]